MSKSRHSTGLAQAIPSSPIILALGITPARAWALSEHAFNFPAEHLTKARRGGPLRVLYRGLTAWGPMEVVLSDCGGVFVVRPASSFLPTESEPHPSTRGGPKALRAFRIGSFSDRDGFVDMLTEAEQFFTAKLAGEEVARG